MAGNELKPADERDAPASTDWEDLYPSGHSPVADRVKMRITGEDYDALRGHLVRRDVKEYAAYLLAGTSEYAEDSEEVLEYLVRDIVKIPPFRYGRHARGFVSIPHDVTREMITAAAGDGIVDDLTVFVIHSHPWSMDPRHSSQDDQSEPTHIKAISADVSGPHGSLIFGADEDSITGRVWPTDPSAIGEYGASVATPLDELVVLREHTFDRIQTSVSRLDEPTGSAGRDEMRDRQALLHDESGNRSLGNADIVVVGAGGLGSDIVHKLAQIGVGRDAGSITIVDPDVVEESNRSRITGAEPSDAGDPAATPEEGTVVPAQWSDEIPDLGTPKVDVLERTVERVDPRITVRTIPEYGEVDEAIEAIRGGDLVVTAMDMQTPRRIISRACQQYMRPHIDAGVGIDTDGTTSIASRMSVSGPGRPCLDCLGALNEDRIQREQHGEDPDAYGIEGNQPAVATVNAESVWRTTVAVHRYCTGLLDGAEFPTGTYDFTSDQRVETANPNPDCHYCGDDGLFRARGDYAPWPGKNLTRTEPELAMDQAPVQTQESQDDGMFGRLRRIVGVFWV
jgi:molybdopterin/thiamine biosynthesis adenylyltransferase